MSDTPTDHIAVTEQMQAAYRIGQALALFDSRERMRVLLDCLVFESLDSGITIEQIRDYIERSFKEVSDESKPDDLKVS